MPTGWLFSVFIILNYFLEFAEDRLASKIFDPIVFRMAIIFYKALYHLPGCKYFIPFFVRNLVGSCARPPEGIGPHTIK